MTDDRRALALTGELLPSEQYVPDIIQIVTGRRKRDEQEITTRTPYRQPSMESDVAVPASQAIFTAVAFGFMVGLMAAAFGWSWRVPVVALGLAFGLGWLWRLRFASSTLWTHETYTMPVTMQHTPSVPSFGTINPAQARKEAAKEIEHGDGEYKREQLQAFADRCYQIGCTERAHGISASGPDRDAFVAARDTLIAIGAARWKNPARPKSSWYMAVSRHKSTELISRHVL